MDYNDILFFGSNVIRGTQDMSFESEIERQKKSVTSLKPKKGKKSKKQKPHQGWELFDLGIEDFY